MKVERKKHGTGATSPNGQPHPSGLLLVKACNVMAISYNAKLVVDKNIF